MLKILWRRAGSCSSPAALLQRPFFTTSTLLGKLNNHHSAAFNNDNDSNWSSKKEAGVVVCSAGQGTRTAAAEFALKTSHVAIPKMESVRKGNKADASKAIGTAGEDSYAIACTRDYAMIAVADGVREWEKEGIDSGLFSRALVSNVHNIFSMNPEEAYCDPRGLLGKALMETQKVDTKGSCTITITIVPLFSVKGEGNKEEFGQNDVSVIARMLTLGDTVMKVARGEEKAIVFTSPVLRFSFGFPFQVSHVSDFSSIERAVIEDVPVKLGDVLLCASDGLCDNLSDKDISEIIAKQKIPFLSSRDLGAASFGVSMDSKCDAPWNLEYMEELDMPVSGGKQDDITIITASLVHANKRKRLRTQEQS
eukprot:m.91047 g.91047  ORF g.91047 m.91047 type:complete len:366 (+) comp8860_c2_seq1:75-1172(+)